jgi:hypothetical protein
VTPGFWEHTTLFESEIVNKNWVRNPYQNTLQRWSVHSEAFATPVDSEKVRENRVGAYWEIINETSSKGDTWICQRLKPWWLRNSQWKLRHCRIRYHQRNWFQRWRVDSSAPTTHLTQKQLIKTESLPTQKSSPKLIPKVTRVDSELLAALVD